MIFLFITLSRRTGVYPSANSVDIVGSFLRDKWLGCGANYTSSNMEM
jgi:hypothetical protein